MRERESEKEKEKENGWEGEKRQRFGALNEIITVISIWRRRRQREWMKRNERKRDGGQTDVQTDRQTY